MGVSNTTIGPLKIKENQDSTLNINMEMRGNRQNRKHWKSGLNTSQVFICQGLNLPCPWD
jgi:hypothetical protein